MSIIQIDEKQLEKIAEKTFKKSFKELWEIEMMKLRANLIPFVLNKEQREIERLYRKPTRKVEKTFTIKI